jgi:hypothetical protein
MLVRFSIRTEIAADDPGRGAPHRLTAGAVTRLRLVQFDG